MRRKIEKLDPQQIRKRNQDPAAGGPYELTIPPQCLSNPSAHEAMRVWVTHAGGADFTLKPDLFGEPGMWGVLIGDLIRHLADGYQEIGLKDAPTAYREIVTSLGRELVKPTGPVTGEWLDTEPKEGEPYA